MELLNITESYWDMLQSEIQQLILKYKESQERIEWRESYRSRKMCWEIESHGQLRRVWFIGPIQCKPRLPKACKCQPRYFFMDIFGYYWDLSGEKKRVFLGYSFCTVIPRCFHVRDEIDYQTNPSYTLSLCSLKLF